MTRLNPAAMNRMRMLTRQCGDFSRANPNVPLKHNPFYVDCEANAVIAGTSTYLCRGLHGLEPIVTTSRVHGNVECAACLATTPDAINTLMLEDEANE